MQKLSRFTALLCNPMYSCRYHPIRKTKKRLQDILLTPLIITKTYFSKIHTFFMPRPREHLPNQTLPPYGAEFSTLISSSCTKKEWPPADGHSCRFLSCFLLHPCVCRDIGLCAHLLPAAYTPASISRTGCTRCISASSY